MSKKMRMALLLAVSLFVVLCLVQAAALAAEPARQPLRVGYLPALSQLPIVVAYENDRMNHVAAQVQVSRYNSFTALEAAFRVGAIDFASLPVPLVFGMAADGHQVRLVGADHVGGSRLVAAKQGDVQSLQSLKGKLIGLPGLDTNENIYLSRLMQANKLRPGLEYKTIRITFSTVMNDFKAGKLDALYLPEPYGTMAEFEKMAVAVDNQEELAGGKLDTVWVVRADYLKASPAAVDEWLKSLASGCRFIEDDIAGLGARQTGIIQAGYLKFPAETVSRALQGKAGGLQFAPLMPETKVLEKILEDASQLKILTKSVDLKTLVDPQPLKRIGL